MRILHPDSIFAVAKALFWYCADWHSGQCSDEYRALSGIGRLYSPGPSERGIDSDNPEETTVYRALRTGRVKALRLLEWINERAD